MKIQTGYLYHIKDEILQKFEYLFKLKSNGVNLFFTDIDNLKEQMMEDKLYCIQAIFDILPKKCVDFFMVKLCLKMFVWQKTVFMSNLPLTL